MLALPFSNGYFMNPVKSKGKSKMESPSELKLIVSKTISPGPLTTALPIFQLMATIEIRGNKARLRESYREDGKVKTRYTDLGLIGSKAHIAAQRKITRGSLHQ